MNYVTELSNVLRDSNVSQDDRQAVLNSLRTLADKGDLSARLALDNSSTSLPGDLRNLSFATVFEHCRQAGWSEQAFEFWARWRQFHGMFLAGWILKPPLDPYPHGVWIKKFFTIIANRKACPFPSVTFFSTN